MSGESSLERHPVYRSRIVLAAIVVLFVIVEAWLAIGILNHGCGVAITFDEWLPVILTLGAGAIGSIVLIGLGRTQARRDLTVLGASLGIGAIAGAVSFYAAYTIFYCM
jgi:hypothetical protein